jgi:tetratricopeptide (TPR) repeat protein
MIKYFITTILLSIGVFFWGFAQSDVNQNENVVYLLKKSQEKLVQLNYEGALEDCEAALAVCPNCSSPYFQKVIIYTAEKKFDEAEKALKKASKLSTKIYDNIRHEIHLKYYRGNVEEAFDILQREIDKDTSKKSIAYWCDARASYFTKEKKYALAYKDYCTIKSIYPNNNRILALMIIHEIHIDAKEKYEQHMKEFTFNKNTKDSANVYYNKGLFSYYLKDYKTALYYFNNALEVNKEMNQAFTLKAINLALLNRYDSALYCINIALEKYKNNSYILYNRGFIYTLAGNFDSAILDLERSIKLYDKDPHPYNSLAYIYSKTDIQKSKYYQQKANEVGGKEHLHYWKLDY